MPANRVIFFDVGHTLAFPPDRFYLDVARAFGGEARLSTLRRAEAHARKVYEAEVIRQGTAQLWRTFFDAFFDVLRIPPSRWDEAFDVIRQAHAQGVGLFHHVPERTRRFLRDLHTRGFRLGVISNADRRLSLQLEFLGLAPLFSWVVSSAEVGVEKPDLRIFDIALSRCGVPPESVMYVGDYRLLDAEPARKRGIQAWVLDPLGLYPDDPFRITRLEDLPVKIPCA